MKIVFLLELLPPTDDQFAVAVIENPTVEILSQNNFSGYFIPLDLIDELISSYTAYDEDNSYGYRLTPIKMY